MQAVRINHTADDLSGIEVLEVPVEEAAPGTLRVRMLKAALHPSDLNYIHGDYRAAIERLIWNHEESSPTFDAARSKPHPELPCIPGGEGVGIVEACGDGIDASAWVGKRVGIFAGPPSGTWQEHIIVAPQQLTPAPDALDDDQAALMMLNPLTALVTSRYVLQAGEGQWLMMSAGASAVSKQVAALGRHFGFKTISLVRNNVNQDDSVQPLADMVINTTEQDFRSEVKRITNGRGVDFALDCVGGELASQMLTCLTDGGRMLLYGTLSGPSMELFSRDLMMTNATLGGFYMPGWLAAQTPEGLGKVFQELGELSATGMFKTPIAAEYPLAQAIDAVRAAQEPGRTGKILLNFSS